MVQNCRFYTKLYTPSTLNIDLILWHTQWIVCAENVKSWFKLGFPTGRDSATFRDSGTAKTFLSQDKGTTGQKFLYCPGTKGQRDKLKILPRDGTGQDSQNLGRDGPGQPKSGTGRGTKRDRAEKDVLKQYKDVLKQKRMF